MLYKVGANKMEFEVSHGGKKGYRHIDIKEKISQMTTRYHLRIQAEILKSMSLYQLRKIIRLAEEELKRRKKRRK